jgi:hypothetical protein
MVLRDVLLAARSTLLASCCIAGIIATASGQEADTEWNPNAKIADSSKAIYLVHKTVSSCCVQLPDEKMPYTVDITFPEVIYAPGQGVRDSINACIAHYLRKPNSPTREGEVLSEATRIITGWSSFAVYPNMLCCDVSEFVKVQMNNDGIFSFSIHVEGYEGGAHPYHTTEFGNIDLTSGHSIHLSDCFVSGFKQPLDSVAEIQFRVRRRLAPDQPLTDYEFRDGKFTLNERFLITEDTIYFEFNEYEITGYAAGSTTISLAWSDIHFLIRPDGPLGWVLNKTEPQR